MRREQIPDLAVELALQRFPGRDLLLQLPNLGHQRLGLRGIAALALRLADLLRGRVAPRLHVLQRLRVGAPLLVELQNGAGKRLKPAPREAVIKVCRIFTNPFEIVHGSPPREIKLGCASYRSPPRPRPDRRLRRAATFC